MDIRILKGGDIGFSYEPIIITEGKISALTGLPLMAMGLFLIVYKYVMSPWMLIGFIIPIAVFIYVYQRMNVGAKNRDIEEKKVLEIIDCEKISNLCKGLYDDDVYCVKRKYILRQTKELGHFERLIVAYMSNRKVVKFRVVLRKGNEKKWNFTIRIIPIETDEKDLVNSILPVKEWIGRKIDPDENAFVAIVLILLLWAACVGCIVIPMLYDLKTFNYVVFSYLLFLTAIKLLENYIPYPQWFLKVVKFPGRIIGIATDLGAPILVLALGILIFISFGALTAAIIYGLSWWMTDGELGLDINYAVFLFVSLFSLTSVYANGWVHSIFERIGLFKSMMEKSLESPVLGFVEYLFQKENFNYLIYTAYLLFIASSTINVYLSKDSSALISEGVDFAVTKAFLVHIAFTNMIAKRKELKIKCEGVLEYVYKILVTK